MAAVKTHPNIDLRLPGRIPASVVQAILHVGPTWLDKGIKDGRYPAPDYVEGDRTRFWNHSTILHFLEHAGDKK